MIALPHLLSDEAGARLGALDLAGEGRALHPRRRVHRVPDQRVLEPLQISSAGSAKLNSISIEPHSPYLRAEHAGRH